MDREQVRTTLLSVRNRLHGVIHRLPEHNQNEIWHDIQAADIILAQLGTEMAPIPESEISAVDALLKITLDQAKEIGKLKASYKFIEARYPFLSGPMPDGMTAHLFMPPERRLMELGLDTWRMMDLIRKDDNGNHEQTRPPGGPGDGSPAGPVHQG